jgi:hypothetical protein
VTRTIRVHFDGKVLIPEGPVDPPIDQSLEVRVIDLGEPEPMIARGEGSGSDLLSGLADWLRDQPRAEDDLPPDMAAQHDHYLYGHPTRP